MWSQSLEVLDSSRDRVPEQPYENSSFRFLADTDVEICLAGYHSVGIRANMYDKRINGTHG